MAALMFFDQRLPGSDFGKPTDPDTLGFDCQVVEMNGMLHLQIRPSDPKRGDYYIAALPPETALELIESLASAVRRIGGDVKVTSAKRDYR